MIKTLIMNLLCYLYNHFENAIVIYTVNGNIFPADMASQQQLADILYLDLNALEVRPVYLPVLSLVPIVELMMPTTL